MSDQFRKGLANVRVAIDLLETTLANDGETWSVDDRNACDAAIEALRSIAKEDDNGRED